MSIQTKQMLNLPKTENHTKLGSKQQKIVLDDRSNTVNEILDNATELNEKPIRKNVEIYSKLVEPLEDLMVELDRSMASAVNLLIKEALQVRGVLKWTLKLNH